MKRSAFTLVELLVVIGIVGLLLAILLPTLGRARAKSKSIACAANLREIARGFQMYLGDNDDLLLRTNPLPYLDPPLNGHPPLTEALGGYVAGEDSDVWRCPSDYLLNAPADLPDDAETYADALGSSYEYNSRLNAFRRLSRRADESVRYLHAVHSVSSDPDRPVPVDRIWIFRDLEDFHGPEDKTGSRNFAFATFAVGPWQFETESPAQD